MVLQLVEAADEDHRRDVAHELGHPEPDIGRAGDDGRLRLGFAAPPRNRRPIAGTISRCLPVADLDARCRRAAPQAAPSSPCARPPADPSPPCRRSEIALRGAHDRLIAGAAAEIALQRLLDRRVGRIGRPHPQPIERHDEARRAEAALRAVEVDHRLLHRMQRAVAALADARPSRHGEPSSEPTKRMQALTLS